MERPWQQRMDRLSGECEACRTEAEALAGHERALAEELERAEASSLNSTAGTQTGCVSASCRKLVTGRAAGSVCAGRAGK
ncbi:hypothetical protein [Paenibacillus sp. DMB5]|uniref:hypothetical protein n=1 Tax=Paenibacillus sp. DMB5 TaxID=1780103 RepID=UPI000FE14A94|nr:hypothetical protein [Paenibacillus sp. DMB5]